MQWKCKCGAIITDAELCPHCLTLRREARASSTREMTTSSGLVKDSQIQAEARVQKIPTESSAKRAPVAVAASGDISAARYYTFLTAACCALGLIAALVHKMSDEGLRTVMEEAWLVAFVVSALLRLIRRDRHKSTNVWSVAALALCLACLLLAGILLATAKWYPPTIRPWPSSDSTADYMEGGYMVSCIVFVMWAPLVFLGLYGMNSAAGQKRFKGHLVNFSGAYTTCCLVLSAFVCFFLVLSASEARREKSAVKAILSLPASASDEQYILTLQDSLGKLIHRPTVENVDTPSGQKIYTVVFKISSMGGLMRSGPGLAAIYESGRNAREHESLGDNAEWDALFTMSVAMALGSQRLGNISEIRYDATVTDDFGRSAEYVAIVDPRPFSGATSREQAEHYAHLNKRVLTDTATGKGFGSVSVPR